MSSKKATPLNSKGSTYDASTTELSTETGARDESEPADIHSEIQRLEAEKRNIADQIIDLMDVQTDKDDMETLRRIKDLKRER